MSRTGGSAVISGIFAMALFVKPATVPNGLATDKEIITILRAVHKYKDSREQFEMRTHKRLIDILDPAAKTVEALMSIELPAGVEIEIKA